MGAIANMIIWEECVWSKHEYW